MDAPTTLEPKSFRLAFAGLLLAMLLGSLDQTIVSTALPRIAQDLNGLRRPSRGSAPRICSRRRR